MQAPTFNDLVQRCNDFLYRHMYPGRTLVFRSAQHRDLVRTFFAGAMEGLIACEDVAAVARLIEDYKPMADPHWVPDDRFRFHNPN